MNNSTAMSPSRQYCGRVLILILIVHECRSLLCGTIGPSLSSPSLSFLSSWSSSSPSSSPIRILSTCHHDTKNRERVDANNKIKLLMSLSSSSTPLKRTVLKPNRRNDNNNRDSKSSTRLSEDEIVRLGRSGKTGEALRVYSACPNPTTRMMNGAIDACARARPPRIETAFSLFESRVESSSLRPNVFTFGALMSCCARGRDADRAVALLSSMRTEHDIRPNGVVYSTAISACERNVPSRSSQALTLLNLAREDPTVRMTAVGYNTAISALARGGDWKTAISILEEMRSSDGSNVPRPDGITYGTVMAACERSGEWKEALRVGDQMKARGLAMDGIALTTALKACQQLSMAEEALEYLQQMKNMGQGDPYKEQRTTKGRQRMGARQALRGPDEVAYCLAISACSRAGRYKDSITLLQEMKNSTSVALKDTKGIPGVNAYTAVINGCAEGGQYQLAFQYLREMIQNGVQPTVFTYSAVIRACASSIAKHEEGEGDVRNYRQEYMKAALGLLEEMKETDAMVSPNIFTYNSAIMVCAEGLNLPKAFELMEEITQRGLEPTIVTFGTLMVACERVGNLRGASKVFSMMKQNMIVPNEIVYGAAISCCRKAVESNRAYLLLRKMIQSDLSPNTATFNTVILALIEDNNTTKALQVFALMEQYRKHAKPNLQTFTILIRALCAQKRPQEADRLLKYMRRQQHARFNLPDVELYTGIVAAYEKTGQPMQAMRLMEEMREDGYDFYENQVLNAAFAKAVKLVNQVGRNLKGDISGGNDGGKNGGPVKNKSSEP